MERQDINDAIQNERQKIADACARIDELMALNRPDERGWICKHHEYGVWFMPWSAAVADWTADQKEYYGKDPEKVDDEAVETWFHEQMGWMEVARDGIQMQRPDMFALESWLMGRMKKDTDFVIDPEKV